MKTEEEIKEDIEKIKKEYDHVLKLPAANAFINAPRALMQILATAQLKTLYWVLNEEYPGFRCDKT